MSSTGERVFSDKELADAGRLTVDLVAESLDRGDTAAAGVLVKRFQQELMTMFYSYVGWERESLVCIEELDGAERREEALRAVEDYASAPEREICTEGVDRRWKVELEQIRALIDGGRGRAAAERARALREQALALHDGLMSRVNALLSFVYETYGEQELGRLLGRVMKPESMDPDGGISFREKVENIMMFTRCHLLPFTVTEDEEKVTFMPDPCPSGARLIRQGHYEAPRNDAIVRGAGALTYGRPELPVYCCHEPAMELGSILRTGVPLFVVDPPEDVGISPCRIHVYKNPADIPESCYQRLGLEKPGDLIAIS